MRCPHLQTDLLLLYLQVAVPQMQQEPKVGRGITRSMQLVFGLRMSTSAPACSSTLAAMSPFVCSLHNVSLLITSLSARVYQDIFPNRLASMIS